jgi:long-chain acyl-CoA synthetase
MISGLERLEGTAAMSDRPWLRHYSDFVPATFEPECRNAVALFDRGDRAQPDVPAMFYFDVAIERATARKAARDLAAALCSELGIERGDRVGVMLQNVPQAAIAFHAIWLAGGVVVPVNPMNKARELDHQLSDSGARAVICLESLYEVVDSVRRSTGVEHIVVTSELEMLDVVPAALAGFPRITCPGAVAFADLVERGAALELTPADPEPGDPALLTYTSGTTGSSKGAVNTHRNLAHNAELVSRWYALGEGDITVGMSPMFHITGIVLQLAAAAFSGTPLLLFNRFDAGEMLRLVEKWRGTWCVGPLTAYVALLECREFASVDLSSLIKTASGGAPVSPAVATRWLEATGTHLLNAYGLTEATAPAILTPLGTQAPIDPDSGALAIGLPGPNTEAKVIDEGGSELPPLELGQIAIRGPQITPGYWNNPDATATTIVDGWLRTGDVGKCDEQGWFYIVDRLKDMIIVSGYKVWPRDVEDVLYQHEAVREAAVIGVPDQYRGESVRAYVSLKSGTTASPEDLIAHCRARLAVYKAPRDVRILDEIPKTLTGKALRRELRSRALTEETSVQRAER